MNKEISDIFKDQLENFEGEVPDDLWSKFQQNPKWQSHLKRKKHIHLAIYSAIVVVAVTTSILLINSRMKQAVSTDTLGAEEVVVSEENVTMNASQPTSVQPEIVVFDVEEMVESGEMVLLDPDEEKVVLTSEESADNLVTEVHTEVANSASEPVKENVVKSEAKVPAAVTGGKKEVTEKAAGQQRASHSSETSSPAAPQPSTEQAEPKSPFIIPNAFTPNGDGLNDIFSPVANGEFQSFQMDIYSRSGQKLFSTQSLSHGWNGEYQGGAMTAGSYVYTIKYKDLNGKEHIEKGQVTLIR